MNPKLINVLEETEKVYLSGNLNGHELKNPVTYVLLESNEILQMRKKEGDTTTNNPDMKISVEKGDSFNFVIDNINTFSGIPLVLNFANPIHPGGGVRNGARAQEEDLCRGSNLLYSLESEEASLYYEQNKKNSNPLGASRAILTENVSILRRTNDVFLEEPINVSILTMDAPIKPRIDEYIYFKILEQRIENMLNIAEFFKYKTLVLGAWGCGVFGNSPTVMSTIFNLVLHKNYTFDQVYFVIKADSELGMHNFLCFKENLK